MKNAVCPSCKKTVHLAERMKVKELITCPNCKSTLELVKKFPPTLDWAEDPSVSSSHRTFSNLY
jgi:DNA-directed RNA polymerase subunit RPC12/RpoP